MASPASHDVRVVKRSALAGVAGVGRRHTRQPRRHVSPRRRRARRPVLPRSNLYSVCTHPFHDKSTYLSDHLGLDLANELHMGCYPMLPLAPCAVGTHNSKRLPR